MQERLLSPALLLALAAALAPGASAQAITGRVVDALGNGVAGVDIDVDNLGSGGDPDVFNDGTDAGGFFTTTLSSGGVFAVLFRPPAGTTHLVAELNPVVVVGTVDLGTIALPPGVSLSGRVVRSGSIPVAGVNLDVLDAGSGELLFTPHDTSDAFGNFSVNVPDGVPLDVRFKTAGVVGVTLAPREIPLTPAGNTGLGDVALAPGFVLSGTVRRPSGAAVAGLDLDLFDPATDAEVYTPGDSTDSLGLFSIVVAAGTYDVEICPAVSTLLVPRELLGVSVAASTSLGVLTLQSGVRLTGTIRDPASQPVPGVDLDVRTAPGGVSLFLCGDNTSASGVYAVVVPPGTYDLELKPPLALPLGRGFDLGVAVGGATTRNLDLPACPFPTPFGAGRAGSGGFVPALGASGGAPRVDNAFFRLELADGLGGSLAFLGLAVDQPYPSRPIGGAGTVGGPGGGSQRPWFPRLGGYSVFPLQLGGGSGVPGAGAATIELPVPLAPLAGLTVRGAFAVADPGAPAGISLSTGLRIDVRL